ncbi:unnamed protein product, partial [Urochloa humidicola]
EELSHTSLPDISRLCKKSRSRVNTAIKMDKTAIIVCSVIGSLGMFSAILGFSAEGIKLTSLSGSFRALMTSAVAEGTTETLPCRFWTLCSLEVSVRLGLVFLQLVWLYQDLCPNNNLVSAILR